MKFPRPSIKKMRSALAVALTLWCAGAGCLVVSYAHVAVMAAELRSVAEESARHEVSGSMSSHACCKARHASAQKSYAQSHTRRLEPSQTLGQIALPENPVPSGAASCCPLTSGSFVSAARVSSDSNVSLPATRDTRSLELSDLEGAPVDGPLRLPNQEHTYLRCCSFLI